MEPYDLTTAGGYTQQSFTAQGVPTGAPSYRTTIADKATLSCRSTDGDFENPNPFSYKKKLTGSLRGKIIVTASNKSYIVQEGYILGPFDPELYTAGGTALDPYNKCLDKFYAQLRRNVDLSIDLYQGRQTLSMIRGFASTLLNPTKALAGAFKALAQPKWRHVLKGSGGKWLEWQYGLRPTLETIYSLTEELVGAVCSDDGIAVVKARAGESWTHYDPASVFCAPYGGLTTQIQFDDSRRCELSLKCTIADAERNALSQFTTLNPVSFFYENIPFSFVLDWVYDVGGYLRSMETALATGLAFHSGYRTDTRQRKIIAGCVKPYKNRVNGSTYSPFLPPRETWVRECKRTVLSAMPIPVLPQIKVSLGAARLLSTASLLTNFLSYNPPRR